MSVHPCRAAWLSWGFEASVDPRCQPWYLLPRHSERGTSPSLLVQVAAWRPSEEQGGQEADRAEDNRGQETPVEVSCREREGEGEGEGERERESRRAGEVQATTLYAN